MNAFADRVKAKFEEPVLESWIPEKAGDELIGTFVRLDKATTAFGPSWVAVLETESGDHRSVWLYHSSVMNGFKQARPTPGELVGVRYEGKKKVENPTPGKKDSYHAYRVVVDRDAVAATPNWDLLGDGEPVADAAPAAAGGGGNEDDIPFARTFA